MVFFSGRVLVLRNEDGFDQRKTRIVHGFFWTRGYYFRHVPVNSFSVYSWVCCAV